MFNSETLEVGIGMAFLFLLISLICTGVKEWLEGILKWRAMDLERAMRTMLNDESGKLSSFLFAHPLISSLYRGHYDPSKLANSNFQRWTEGNDEAKHMPLHERRNLPSYIPSDQFAKALIDLVGRGPATTAGESSTAGPLSIDQVRSGAEALTSSPFLQRIVLSAIDHADGNLKQLTDNLQHWFDGTMDRASGWYKRRTQGVLFALGLGAAVLLNIDSLYIMTRLTEDKIVRATVVSAAMKYQESSPPGDTKVGLETTTRARAELEKLGMPIGWKQGNQWWWPGKPVQMCKAEVDVDADSNSCNATQYTVFRLLVGWLITAFAVMLGAPFWFDVLNKFVVIRSTIKPGEKPSKIGKPDQPESSTNVPSNLVMPQLGAPNLFPIAPHPADSGYTLPPAPFIPHQWQDGVVNHKEIQL